MVNILKQHLAHLLAHSQVVSSIAIYYLHTDGQKYCLHK